MGTYITPTDPEIDRQEGVFSHVEVSDDLFWGPGCPQLPDDRQKRSFVKFRISAPVCVQLSHYKPDRHPQIQTSPYEYVYSSIVCSTLSFCSIECRFLAIKNTPRLDKQICYFICLPLGEHITYYSEYSSFLFHVTMAMYSGIPTNKLNGNVTASERVK